MLKKCLFLIAFLLLIYPFFISCNKEIKINNEHSSVPFFISDNEKFLNVFFLPNKDINYFYSYSSNLEAKRIDKESNKWIFDSSQQTNGKYYYWEKAGMEVFITSIEIDGNFFYQIYTKDMEGKTFEMTLKIKTLYQNDVHCVEIDSSDLLIAGRGSEEDQYIMFVYNHLGYISEINGVKSLKCESIGPNDTYCIALYKDNEITFYQYNHFLKIFQINELSRKWKYQKILNFDIKKGKRKGQDKETIIYCLEFDILSTKGYPIQGECFDIHNNINSISLYIIYQNNPIERHISIVYDTSFKLLVWENSNFEIYNIEEKREIEQRVGESVSKETKMLRYYETNNLMLHDYTVFQNTLYLIMKDSNDNYFLQKKINI